MTWSWRIDDALERLEKLFREFSIPTQPVSKARHNTDIQRWFEHESSSSKCQSELGYLPLVVHQNLGFFFRPV